MTALSAWSADLKRAAGPGAAKVAAAVVADGNIEAKTNIVAHVPGPALRSILAGATGHAAGSADAVPESVVPKIAAHMAADALNQGARLLTGGQ